MAASTDLAFDWGTHRSSSPSTERNAEHFVSRSPPRARSWSRRRRREEADIVARVRRGAPWIARQRARFERWRPGLGPDNTRAVKRISSSADLIASGRHVARRTFGWTEGGSCSWSRPTDHAFRFSVLRHWYRLQAHQIFPERLHAVLPPFGRQGILRPRLVIRDMTHRWGSYTPKKSLVLNLDLVRASPSFIDYVIAHELAHALHPDHGSGWEDLLTRLMPDWRCRKDELERQLL